MPKTYLFVPGNRPERFIKAHRSGAHACIIDLEDAVGAEHKNMARDVMADFVSDRDADLADVPLYARVNSHDTSWFEDDLAMIKSIGATRIVLPKAGDVEVVRHVLDRVPGAEIILLMESAAGFLHLDSLCGAKGVRGLMLGSVDLALDLDVGDEDLPLHHYRSLLVQHSRAASLAAPVDGVCTAIGDSEKLASEVARARRFGFGAKACIHPNQVELINNGFLPTAAQIEWARKVVGATQTGAAIALEGELIDVPVLERAKRILKEAPERLG